MKVKICGVKDVYATREAVKAGADFIGFMFAESKRKITIEKAKELASYVPEMVNKVGVFVNPPLEELISTIEEVGLDMVQLHGDETPAYCQRVPVPVIKAFPIKEKLDIHRAESFSVDYFLFDSPGGKYRGGNGMAFDWKMLRNIEISREKVIVAGGLTPSNVGAAIKELNPAIVDVSSGVETNGVKDAKKIKAFIHQAKSKERGS
ncbi:phosphoribosylanthranilate isomerase [Oceanobacillus limi]|uniref:N-(5'-phosphoribosyl)anthranilate isomerase n=1 Tax=Oceanobacillus limi TaxID=930131 RepID=A0A1I0CGS0_9BACI|nr:phosphoribosylanthranilate isomerase [Oceanobacillus limi]SET18714.1 phosphoribosylanthranilate isomerase [Oceanobacillus limi]